MDGAGPASAAAGAAVSSIVKRKKKPSDAEIESYRQPKIPRTLSEKDSEKRLIVVLEGASLESVNVGKSYQLLSASDHMNIIKKNGREGINLRPDITHQCLLMLLDSPLNKAGLLQVYIHTSKNVLIEVNPATRIPRVYNRFASLMVQLLKELSISAKGKGAKLLKIIKNPVTQYLPTGCRKVAMTYSSDKLVKAADYFPKVALDVPIAVVIGAVAHGQVDTSWCDEDVAISGYAMSAAGVCAKVTGACEDMWGVH
eukprot:m.235431 g.235431  ORF g.235431 m.235431 type:complete len:256 (-) comp26151_c0_seq1:3507-4274(-)